MAVNIVSEKLVGKGNEKIHGTPLAAKKGNRIEI